MNGNDQHLLRTRLTQCLGVVQAVAAEMGNRTAQQVQHYYRDNMQARKKGAWSSEEDAALLKVPFHLPTLCNMAPPQSIELGTLLPRLGKEQPCINADWWECQSVYQSFTNTFSSHLRLLRCVTLTSEPAPSI